MFLPITLPSYLFSKLRVLRETPVYTVYMEEEMHLNFVKDIMRKKKTLLV